MLYAEGRWYLAVVNGEADLLPGFAACDLICMATEREMSA